MLVFVFVCWFLGPSLFSCLVDYRYLGNLIFFYNLTPKKQQRSKKIGLLVVLEERLGGHKHMRAHPPGIIHI